MLPFLNTAKYTSCKVKGDLTNRQGVIPALTGQMMQWSEA